MLKLLLEVRRSGVPVLGFTGRRVYRRLERLLGAVRMWRASEPGAGSLQSYTCCFQLTTGQLSAGWQQIPQAVCGMYIC